MPTLHSNNPVPSNGSVATVIRGEKSISMTLSGVGAVRAVVQIMAKEEGAAAGPIGSQIVISGTTTVTTTQTFNAEAGEVYLQLIDITPACKFSASLTDVGPIQDTNPGSPSSPFATTADLYAYATANLASLLSGRSTAWVGSVEMVWNGPLNTDWAIKTPPANAGDVCLFGNSIMEQSGGRFVQGFTDFWNSRGFPVLAAALSGGRARIVENWGIGGQTSADLLARIDQAKRSRAGTIVVIEATNDNNGVRTAADVIPNYKALADGIIASGKFCVMCTGIPLGGATAHQIQFLSNLNAWLTSYNPSPLYRCSDVASPIRGNDGLPITDALISDNKHPSAYGASKMAVPLAATFAEIMPKRNLTEALLNTERNLLANPLFAGSGTSAPTSWNVQSAPASWAYVAAPEVNATRTTVPVATVNAGGSMVLTQNVAVASLPVGFRAKASVRLKAENLDPAPASNTQNIQAYFQYYNGSTFTGSARADYWDSGANYKNCPLTGELELVCNSGVVPSGTTLVQLVIQCTGGGTYTLLESFLGTDPGPSY